jgi:hypothetical protein
MKQADDELCQAKECHLKGSKELLKRSPSPIQQGKDEDVMVEIAPGVSTHLRRKQETVQAVRDGFFAPIHCFSCRLLLFCIADVCYVVCPECKVVSPLEDNPAAKGHHAIIGRRHGLGLGITEETLGNLL